MKDVDLTVESDRPPLRIRPTESGPLFPTQKRARCSRSTGRLCGSGAIASDRLIPDHENFPFVMCDR